MIDFEEKAIKAYCSIEISRCPMRFRKASRQKKSWHLRLEEAMSVKSRRSKQIFRT